MNRELLALDSRPGRQALPPDEGSVARFAIEAERMASSISAVVVTSPATVRLALVGLFSEGHILLEDLPGVGKTLLAKTIARSIDGVFKRVQFTPDLLPSDITGTTVFEAHTGKFQFIAGPVFSNILLADEVNRTGPRTQAALLEAMAEAQVTVDGELRQLRQPFTVIATQNLSESHGTFPLPDSQKDRFLISMGIGMPSVEQEVEILARAQRGSPEARPVLTTDRVIEMQALVKSVEVSQPVRQYLVNVLRAVRQHRDIWYGASPRGGTALQRASQCLALFNARSFVTPEDIREMAVHVLTHRLILKPGASISEREAVLSVLDEVPVPA